MKRWSKYFYHAQKGQSLVEFALLVPIFVIMLFGIMEFARLWETMNVLTGAAREGARVAAVTSPSVSQVTDAVERLLGAANISGASVTVSGPNSDAEVIVTVSINYTPLTGSIVPGIGAISLTRSSAMHWEG